MIKITEIIRNKNIPIEHYTDAPLALSFSMFSELWKVGVKTTWLKSEAGQTDEQTNKQTDAQTEKHNARLSLLS